MDEDINKDEDDRMIQMIQDDTDEDMAEDINKDEDVDEDTDEETNKIEDTEKDEDTDTRTGCPPCPATPWMMELFLAGTESGVGCASPGGVCSI